MYEHGGECFVNAHVDEIIVKNNKAIGVRVCKSSSLDSGKPLDEKPKMTEIYAPVIINATGMHNLYNKLLPQDLPVVQDFKNTNTSIPSYGHNYLFVAIKGTFFKFPPFSIGLFSQSKFYATKHPWVTLTLHAPSAVTS